jgi:hypothetical protein
MKWRKWKSIINQSNKLPGCPAILLVSGIGRAFYLYDNDTAYAASGFSFFHLSAGWRTGTAVMLLLKIVYALCAMHFIFLDVMSCRHVPNYPVCTCADCCIRVIHNQCKAYRFFRNVFYL